MKIITYFTPTLFLLMFKTGLAQVGINTADPKATLDVNGNVIIRSTPQTSTLPG